MGKSKDQNNPFIQETSEIRAQLDSDVHIQIQIAPAFLGEDIFARSAMQFDLHAPLLLLKAKLNYFYFFFFFLLHNLLLHHHD